MIALVTADEPPLIAAEKKPRSQPSRSRLLAAEKTFMASMLLFSLKSRRGSCHLRRTCDPPGSIGCRLDAVIVSHAPLMERGKKRTWADAIQCAHGLRA